MTSIEVRAPASASEGPKPPRTPLPADDELLRLDLRRWFADNPPPLDERPSGSFDQGIDERAAAAERGWQRRLYDAGWAGIAWPAEYGGRGASPRQQLLFHEELQRAGGGLPRLFFVGLSHAGPTLIGHGTAEQRARFLPGVLRGDVVFCQLFSEPGAGSDLASLSAFGRVEGDELVVSGEKRWSTFAQHADRAELLVRTDRAHKQGGLTFALLDMHSPGITTRPLPTLSGAAEFCEVHLDEVRIPLADVVGGLGQGWKIATTTLAHERSTAFAPLILSLEHAVARLMELTHENPVAQSEVAALAIRSLGLRALLLRSVEEQELSEPGPAASAMKLLATELNLDITRFAAWRLGINVTDYFTAFGLRIGGGTSEVQRNILAERVLGLPREPRPA